MVKTLNYKVAALFILLGSILFGTGYILSIFGLERGLTPLNLIAGRMFIASLLINIVFLNKVRSITKKEIVAGVTLGSFMFGVFAFQVIGLQYTTASISAFVSSVYVVLIPLIHWAYYKKAPDRYSNIGTILTIIGVGFISLGDGLHISIGIVLTLISTIFAAFQIFCVEIFSKKYDPVTLTIIMLNTCFLISTLFSIVTYSTSETTESIINFTNITIILGLGIISTIIPYLLQNIGQKYVSATKASLIMSTEAIFGTIFSIIIFNDKLSLQMIFGCFLIILAIIIAETKLKFK